MTPESLSQIVAEARAAYPSNIEQAVDVACANWRRHPDRNKYKDELERFAVRELVYQARGVVAKAIRNESGVYARPAAQSAERAVCRPASQPVAPMTPRLNETILNSVLDNYPIAGTVLGNLLGKDLPAIAQQERSRARGHQANATLCELLIPLVPEGKRVRDSVNDGRAKQLIRQAQNQLPPEGRAA